MLHEKTGTIKTDTAAADLRKKIRTRINSTNMSCQDFSIPQNEFRTGHPV